CCLRKGATSATLVDQWVKPNGQNGNGDGDGDGKGNGQSPVVAAKGVAPGGGPAGTVRALRLQVGDVLIFEEVIGPRTGNPADADPAHRQAVRLTKVTQSVDPLYHPYGKDFGQPIVEIEWCAEDALTFPLCISWQAPVPDCGCLENVSIARGNVI